MSLPPLIQGHIYCYSYSDWSFVGIFDCMEANDYRFKFLSYVNYDSTWTLDYFTCDDFNKLTHIGSPTDFPEYLL